MTSTETSAQKRKAGDCDNKPSNKKSKKNDVEILKEMWKHHSRNPQYKNNNYIKVDSDHGFTSKLQCMPIYEKTEHDNDYYCDGFPSKTCILKDQYTIIYDERDVFFHIHLYLNILPI